MSAMADMSTGIDELIAAHQIEQCKTHVALAEALERFSRRSGAYQNLALVCASVHVELARRYQLLARAVRDGYAEWLASGDAALTALEEMAGTTR